MLPLIGCAIAIVSGLYAGAVKLDSVYAHKSELKQLAQDDEQAGLETKLRLYKLELAALRAKAERTADDDVQIRFLEDAIITTQKRLAGLAKGG